MPLTFKRKEKWNIKNGTWPSMSIFYSQVGINNRLIKLALSSMDFEIVQLYQTVGLEAAKFLEMHKLQCTWCRNLGWHVDNGYKGKGRSNVNLYGACLRTPLMPQIWIIQCYLQTTPCLPLPVNIPQAAPPCINAQRMPEFNLLLIYRPLEDEWLSWLTTADGSSRGGHSSTECHGSGQGKFAGCRPTFSPLSYATNYSNLTSGTIKAFVARKPIRFSTK